MVIEVEHKVETCYADQSIARLIDERVNEGWEFLSLAFKPPIEPKYSLGQWALVFRRPVAVKSP